MPPLSVPSWRERIPASRIKHRKNAKSRPMRRSTRTIGRYPCGGATAPPAAVGVADAVWTGVCCVVGAVVALVVPVVAAAVPLGGWVTAAGVEAAPVVPVDPAPVAAVP